jgi:hypothetical protein
LIDSNVSPSSALIVEFQRSIAALSRARSTQLRSTDSVKSRSRATCATDLSAPRRLELGREFSPHALRAAVRRFHRCNRIRLS